MWLGIATITELHKPGMIKLEPKVVTTVQLSCATDDDNCKAVKTHGSNLIIPGSKTSVTLLLSVHSGTMAT